MKKIYGVEWLTLRGMGYTEVYDRSKNTIDIDNISEFIGRRMIYNTLSIDIIYSKF